MFGGISHKIASRKTPSYTDKEGIYLHGFVTGSRTNSYTLPEDCQVNDILVFWSSGVINPYTLSGSGFTNLLTRNSSSGYPGCAFGVRRLASGFSTTFTVGDGRYSTIIGVFRNVTTASLPPVDGPGTQFSANFSLALGISSTPNPAAYTTTIGIGTAMVVCGCLSGFQNKSTVVAPSNYTLVAAEDGTGDGRTETVAMAYRILPSSGSEDPGGFSGFGGSNNWIAMGTSLLAS